MTMSYLSMMEARLPPGFRFHPRDDELVCDYLVKKVTKEIGSVSFHGCPMIIVVDLNKCEPWDLPEMACVGGKDWYFFSLRDRKYATGQRTNRATQTGYWKATGKDKPVTRNNVLVGMRKTLVFYGGRAPHGSKTDWVMHEFRMEPAPDPSKFSFKEDWVLCKVTLKSKGDISKPDTRKCQDDTSCSYIPPHKDTYLTFDQTTPLSLEGYEQVPCFSILSSHGVAAPPMSLPDQSSYDKRYNKTSLNHFNNKLDGYSKMEHPPNDMQGNLSDFLSENGVSHMWRTS